jgi:hypothetical protein
VLGDCCAGELRQWGALDKVEGSGLLFTKGGELGKPCHGKTTATNTSTPSTGSSARQMPASSSSNSTL